MPLLLTGGVELLEPQAVRTEPKERARIMATRVARAGCEYSPQPLFEVGNVLVSSSVTTYQCPAMTNRTWIPGTSSGIPCGHHSNARPPGSGSHLTPASATVASIRSEEASARGPSTAKRS